MANENLKAQKIYGKYIKDLPQVTEVNDTDDIIIEDSTPVTNRAKLGVLFDSIKKRIASTWKFTELNNQTIVEYASELNKNITSVKSVNKNITKMIGGSKVVSAKASTSVQVFSNSEINKALGVTNSSNANTAVLMTNGDGLAQKVHVEGSTYLDGAWHATFNQNASTGSIRINYVIFYFGK